MPAQQEQMTVTADQFTQAAQNVREACRWSEPPKSDTVSAWERVDATRQSLELLFFFARKGFPPLEVVEPSTNGSGHVDNPVELA